MRFTLEQVAAATGGRVHGNGFTEVDGVTQDSREVRPGMLFVPLVAERDGHDFIDEAVARGASAYLTARGPAAIDAAAVEVDDTQEALTALAGEARSRLGSVPVVGITGSVGKTTTKDLLAAVLGRDRRVWASTRSFNNEIGVPITLLSAPDDAEALVVEMGSRGAGHIAELCRVAQPTMGVVTTVGLSHTSALGSLAAVVSAKRELVEGLPAAADGGVAFLNAGVPEVAAMAQGTAARVVTYGDGGEVQAGDLTLDDELTPRFVLRSPGGEVPVRLGARGAHSVDNALAAAAVGGELGVSLKDVAAGLAEPTLSPLRMEVLKTVGGARLLNDCYNANPLSMRAALHALAALPARRRIAVLGVMAELGDFEAAEHAAAASLSARLDIAVVAVDAPGYSSGEGNVTEAAGIDGALAALRNLGGLGAGDAVLVKGSRVAGLERLVARLVSDADV
ncbi:MAG: UDP-N-acetylmuramoyl-tripeptide--D-alanyl-D-alanine ligase [Acidimicrobiaceae bacterium]|nr:UDP-N-acetylmuramoyl-tripeptide--D-alanyl-D-alanine ligase [Acidimicrobiaceae bacterium]MYF42312.1 UDP-N-acetylmuramoyl-tripeptide--D-alanyl-D-alanine ligase [Acidimicrobiaceae bacterium]MYJ36214.1 UDP-N-acetylmuramoyl-tripeptide--D-alanyl-D-alanine ligase [Acidimicrobiaceae bacterium]